MNKVPSKHWRSDEEPPTWESVIKEAITTASFLAAITFVLCKEGCQARAHDVPEDIPTVDVDRLEILHTHDVVGKSTPNPASKYSRSYTLIWNWRDRVGENRQGDFICDAYAKSAKIPTFRAGYHSVFMFDEKGRMYKVRSRYLKEAWSRTEGGIGGDPEINNKRKYPKIQRRGILKTPKK